MRRAFGIRDDYLRIWSALCQQVQLLCETFAARKFHDNQTRFTRGSEILVDDQIWSSQIPDVTVAAMTDPYQISISFTQRFETA